MKQAIALLCALSMLGQLAAPAAAQFQQESGGPVEEGGGSSAPAGPAAETPAVSAPAAPAPAMPEEPAEEPAPVPRAAPRPPIETKVTLRVTEAPLASFLNAISAQAKVSFVLGEGVDKTKITAYLQNVTVREALDVLLETKGLTYSRIGKTNTFVVSLRTGKGPPVASRIYQLNYIPLIDPAGGGGGGGGNAPSSGGQQESGIVGVIKSALSANGKIAIDPRTNSLIITDVSDSFPKVEQLIAELDKKSPQVMFEAQIVEIDTDRSQQLGIEWGGSGGELATYTGPARTTDWPLRPGLFSGNKVGFFFPPSVNTQGLAPADQYTANDITPGVLNLAQLTAVLKAMVTRSEARFLGKPKVLTLNNQSASIEITRDQAIGQQTVAASVGTTGSSTSTGAERKTTGLILKVTPQVNKEGYITVLVEPNFSDVVGSSISPGVFDPVVRKAQTLVRVKNGQTLVLGGLLQSKETKIVRKVPFLGYIPIIGWLFTSQTTQRSNTDLVIFITPTVLND